MKGLFHHKKSADTKPCRRLKASLWTLVLVTENEEVEALHRNGVADLLGNLGHILGEDAAEFILAGCCAVEVGTQNFVDPTSAPRIAAELEQWAADQGVSDINELIGAFEC